MLNLVESEKGLAKAIYSRISAQMFFIADKVFNRKLFIIGVFRTLPNIQTSNMERFARIFITAFSFTICSILKMFDKNYLNLSLGTYVDNDGTCSNVSNVTITRISKK